MDLIYLQILYMYIIEFIVPVAFDVHVVLIIILCKFAFIMHSYSLRVVMLRFFFFCHFADRAPLKVLIEFSLEQPQGGIQFVYSESLVSQNNDYWLDHCLLILFHFRMILMFLPIDVIIPQGEPRFVVWLIYLYFCENTLVLLAKVMN